jgi:hypothetical protein
MIAEKFVSELSSRVTDQEKEIAPAFDNDIEADHTFEDILKLAGLK